MKYSLHVKSLFAAIVVLMSLSLVACKGAEGPTGPQGITGEQGPQGPEGPEGPEGNANVLLYEFEDQEFTNSLNLEIDIEREVVDFSLVLIYYNPEAESASAWYQIPGLGSGGAYQTRFFIFQSTASPSVYTVGIRLLTPDGSSAYGSSVTFRKIKVIFAEASSIFNDQQMTSPMVDLEDYRATSEFLGIE